MRDYLCEITCEITLLPSLKVNVATDEDKDRNEMRKLNKEMKLE